MISHSQKQNFKEDIPRDLASGPLLMDVLQESPGQNGNAIPDDARIRCDQAVDSVSRLKVRVGVVLAMTHRIDHAPGGSTEVKSAPSRHGFFD